MIDLHSHILHAVDDGARTLQDAVMMARIAAEQGVTVMAATPHGHSSVSAWAGYSTVKLYDRLEELRAALTAARVTLEIVPGTEIYGEPGALERLQSGQLLPYGETRAVLIEFPLGVTFNAAEQIIFAFQIAGRRVVIAHPERYRFVQHDPNTLIPLIERGALMQVTGDALLGRQGGRLLQIAEALLSHGMIQLIASDAHGPHVDRMPNMAEARDYAAAIVGAATADALTQTVPAAILQDAPIPTPTPRPVRRWQLR